MRQVVDYPALSAAISACMRPGMLTNCTLIGEELRREMAAGTLYAHPWAGGLLLFRRREGFWRMYYYINDPGCPPDLPWPSQVVTEIVRRPRDTAAAADLWQAWGFVREFTRIRMQRPGSETGEALPPPEAVDAEEAMDLLRWCFDPRTGCLPDLEELAADCAGGRVLTRRDEGGRLIALLRAAPYRKGWELRHLAADPGHRGEGLAGSLAAEFTRRFGEKGSVVWVREDYAAPRHIYEKNGFCPDGWTAAVLIRKDD